MRSISDEKIYDLVAQLYETAKDISSEAWLDVYQKMARLLSAGAGGLSLYSQNEDHFDLVATTLDQDLVEQYNDFYQHVSPFRKKIVQLNAGDRFSRARHLADHEFIKSEIYQDYFKKQNVFNYEYEVLFKNSGVSGGVSFSRPETMEDFGENELKAMEMLLPHLRRAFQLYLKIAECERDKRIMVECLGKISQGVIVLDKHGKIVFLNDSASKIIAEKDGFQISRGGTLLTNSAHETKKLQTLVQSVFDPNIKRKVSFGGVLQISRASGLRPLSLLISPFTEQNAGSFGLQTFALLFINDPEQKVKNVEPILREMYGLTVAESKIAAILAQGDSLNTACELLEIKQNTVRTHLKRIFSKTDTNRQSELVKLILNSPANLKNGNLKNS